MEQGGLLGDGPLIMLNRKMEIGERMSESACVTDVKGKEGNIHTSITHWIINH